MNKLHNQVSPYLLQHKNNPVHWQPWGAEVLQKAKVENKPIILSIGYAACHWCHVMEYESFEDKDVADLMNHNFVNIKVDREERPDIDQIYMEAVYHMGLSGGWPLNVFLMPDQKPFYGGTYFPKNKWKQILTSISDAFKNHEKELQKSADGFQNSINNIFLNPAKLEDFTSPDFQIEIIKKIKSSIDPYFGGINKAPKFPMPTLWSFLETVISLTTHSNDLEKLQDLTLLKMAQGGIFDHVEGGFSRYSVDSEWFCPHFEKMLYDNGQLLSTYAIAFKRTQKLIYKEVIDKIISFHDSTLLGPNGLYFASMDADSEGVEGKFYVWTFDDLNSILPFSLNENFYNDFSITKMGNWEHGNNILFKKDPFESELYANQINIIKNYRSNRIAPSIDTKQILSWNAIYLVGLIDVFNVTQEVKIKNKIESLFLSIDSNLIINSEFLHQSNYSNTPIYAFLDDLAFCALANLKWYLIVNDVSYLHRCENLVNKMITDFYDERLGVFTYSNLHENQLIANLPELIDSVIPSSNSVVTECLFYLGSILDVPNYTIVANKLVENVLEKATQNPTYFSNWWRIMLEFKWNEKIILKSYNSPVSVLELKKIVSEISDKIIVVEKSEKETLEMYLICQGEQCFAPLKSIDEVKNLLIDII